MFPINQKPICQISMRATAATHTYNSLSASSMRLRTTIPNIAEEYATKRYRSNLMNWGMIPLLTKDSDKLKQFDYVFIPNVKTAVLDGKPKIAAYIIRDTIEEIEFTIGICTQDERDIMAAGCLINYYSSGN